ncbi:hypothetical protein OSB04_002229 [Centaurea solstitialis]|uniref:Uncharacterized protein n=1 Tax=Centaurea solstitialis TaxID=347529 RepID=A0AA38TSH2_9ASTR|nr:hypothetical protein OSB04_002229 [Centaurea solstitialis]
MLVHGTQVNDRGWKARYVFVQTSSVVDEESWVVPEWNKGAIDFSFEETTEAIERFLSYSVTDRKYRTSKGGDESDVEPEVQVIEETNMEGSASKKASTMEAAARAAKRKAAAQEGLVAKRTRSSYVSLDTPPKDAARKAEGGIEAVPLSFAPPAKGAGASKVDKGKEKEGSGLTTMTIQMPSDFMVDDVIRTKSTFSVLEQFHVPAQKARMEEADIEDLDASIAGISFLREKEKEKEIEIDKEMEGGDDDGGGTSCLMGFGDNSSSNNNNNIGSLCLPPPHPPVAYNNNNNLIYSHHHHQHHQSNNCGTSASALMLQDNNNNNKQ